MKREHGFPAGHPFPVPPSTPNEKDRHLAPTYLGYRLSAVASHSSGGTPVVFLSTEKVRQPKNGEQRNLNDSAASGSGPSTALLYARIPAVMTPQDAFS